MRLQVGQRVLHFVLERKLGEGGFGEVWRAKAGLAATALKFVSVAGEDLERGRKEYSRIKLMIENGAFNHDRLIKLHGAWLLDANGEDIPDGVLESAVAGRTMELPDQMVEPDTLLIQMDLGQESLASMLKRIRKGLPEEKIEGVPVEDLLRYIREAAEGIDFLNTPRTGFDGQIRNAVYHCDIKPENLLLADGKVRICDYGVARMEGQRKTRSPNALSLAHASPELVEDRPCAQSDQYSLAVTYAQLRTGRLPFNSDVLGGTWRTVMRAVTAGELDLSALEPRERAVIKKATSLQPKKRYNSATDMARELARAVTGQTNVEGYDEVRSRRRRLPLPSLKWVAAVLMLALIAGGAYQYGPALIANLPSWGGDGDGDPDSDAELAVAQALFRESVADGDYDPALFDNLANIAKARNKKLAQEDLDALATAISRTLEVWFRTLDRRDRDPISSGSVATIKKDRNRVATHLSAEQAESLLNRFRLLEARRRLREQWPNAAERPSQELSLFTGDAAALATGDTDLPGFVKNDAANLSVMRVLAAWPADAEKLTLADLAGKFAAANAAAPSKPEEDRLETLGKDLEVAARNHIAAHGIDDTVIRLKDHWGALGVDPASLCMDAVLEKDRAGDEAGAKQLFESLLEFIKVGNDPDSAVSQVKVEWFEAIFALSGPNAATALETLDARIGGVGPEELNRLVQGLVSRFSQPLPKFQADPQWAKTELALLNQAIALCDGVAATGKATDVAIPQARLIAERVLVRLLLPADQENNWNAWLTDARAVDEAMEQTTQLHEELEGSEIAESLKFALLELQLQQPAGATPEGTSKRNVYSHFDFNAAADAPADNPLPGYASFVTALADAANGDKAEAASRLSQLYATDGAAKNSSEHIAGLAWPERVDKSIAILTDSAQALRSPDDRDLSVPAFTPTDAAAAVANLELAQQLRGGSPAPGTLSLLATYYQAPESPPASLLERIEKALADDADRQDPNATALLLVSARLNAAAGKNAVAVARYAEALARYNEWSKNNDPNAARDEIEFQEVEQGALQAADALYDAVSRDAASPLRGPLAQLYGGAALQLTRQALAAGQDAHRDQVTTYFRRATALAPNAETARAEALWLKRFHSGRLDDDWKRLATLAEALPAADPARMAIQAYVLYRGYVLETDPATKRDKLRRAIELYGEAIAASATPQGVDPQVYFERGDSYLQLAHVAHRARAELGETDATIFEYLQNAVQNAQQAIDAHGDPALRIEALNLAGNATEDMAYYKVDPDRNAWKQHYAEATRLFNQAYAEDPASPIAAFNLARCEYRNDIAQRRYDAANATRDGERIAGAMNSVQDAILKWGEADNPKKAEAHYWLSKLQEDLNQLDDADKSRRTAVDMADRLDDPNWQTYQYEFARLALQRWRSAAAAPAAERNALTREAQGRAKRILVQQASSAANPTAMGAKRVDPVTAAKATAFIIELEGDVNEAISTVDTVFRSGSFSGDDAVNRACRAELRLALAARIMGLRLNMNNAEQFAQLKPQAAQFANEVLQLTEEGPNRQSQAVNRAYAYWTLGELDRVSAKPTLTSDQKVRLLTSACQNFALGIEAIPADMETQFQAVGSQLDNTRGLLAATSALRPFQTPLAFKVPAKKAYELLELIRPHVEQLPSTLVIGGESAGTWMTDITRYSAAFKAAAGLP